MGIVNIMTPKGPVEVTIAGDTPTDEEMNNIRNFAPPDNPDEGFDYRLIDKNVGPGMGNTSPPPDQGTQTPEPAPQEVRPSTEMGEIEDYTYRYNLGRQDNLKEKRNFLTDTLGSEAIKEVENGTFLVDQSKVAPEKREELGMQDSGFIYANKPGFTRYDFADFTGEDGPALVTGLGVGIALIGTTATLPAMAIVAGATAIVKGVDEIIDQIEGYNTEDTGDVVKNVLATGLEHGLFEGGGRLVVKGASKIFKTRGPTVGGAAVDEVIARDPTGKMKTKEAMTRLEKLAVATGLRLDPERIAQEEAKFASRELINQGAIPTVGQVSGLDRSAQNLLALAEKVVENPAVGKANVVFIKKILKDLNSGTITEETAAQMFKAQSEEIAKAVNRTMANPEEAVKYSKRVLGEVINKEIKLFEKLYSPKKGVPSDYAEMLPLVSKLFQTQSSKLYKNAEELIGDEATTFSMEGIQQAVRNLKGSNAFVEYKGTLFDIIEKTPTMGLQQLQQLKQALSLGFKDPELIASSAQAGISRIIKAVDETIDAKFVQLSEDLAAGGRTVRLDNGNVFRLNFGPAVSDGLRQGLGAWKKAANYYTEGQKDFNSLAVNTIIKTVKDKFWSSNIDVAEAIIKPGNAPQLKTYLEAVTPRGESAGELSKQGAARVIENISNLANQGRLVEANKLVDNFFPEGTVPKIGEFITKLKDGDVFVQMHMKEYGEQLEQLRRLALAGGDPIAVREAAKNGLAKTWIQQSLSKSKDNRGRPDFIQFSQKFFALGDDVQNTLFGKDAAAVLRNTMDKTYLLGEGQDVLIKNIGTFKDKPLKESLIKLKTIVDDAVEDGKIEVFKLIRSGSSKIEDPQVVLRGVLESPAAFKRLKALVGEAELEKMGGLRETAVQMLLSRTSLTEAAVQAGDFGKQFGEAIIKMNKNGGLDAVLGVDTVKELSKLADNTAAFAFQKGLGGLVGPAAKIAKATAMSAAAVTSALAVLTFGYLAGPALASIKTAAGLTLLPKIVSRFWRNPTVLKLLTSPSFRAADYDAMIAAGANLPSRASLRESNKLMYDWNNRLLPILQETISQVSASGALNVPFKEDVRGIVEDKYDPTGKKVKPSFQELKKAGLEPLPQTPQQVLDIFDPSNPKAAGTVVDPLRQLEQEKMLGIR
tara:strand:- start:427 stop:3891 length:3465 start_codon:yes stop_codon:yes gene_type:complete